MFKLTDAVNYFRNHEGVVSHMYLDIVGLVTAGVGFLLRTADDAVTFHFVNRATGAPATADQIRQDWNAVNAQPKAKRADFYKPFTKLDLPPDQIDAKLTALINSFLTNLRGKFPNFDSFPPTAQIGLLDMIYSLGPDGLASKFPTFCRAVSSGDWTKAAAECERLGVSPTRNADCKQLFLDAAKAAKSAGLESVAGLESAAGLEAMEIPAAATEILVTPALMPPPFPLEAPSSRRLPSKTKKVTKKAAKTAGKKTIKKAVKKQTNRPAKKAAKKSAKKAPAKKAPSKAAKPAKARKARAKKASKKAAKKQARKR